MAVPHILPESKTTSFKFYESYAIHEAVFHEGQILKLAGVFSCENKREALNFAYALAQNYFTLITPGSAVYRIWVDIHCQQDFSVAIPLATHRKSRKRHNAKRLFGQQGDNFFLSSKQARAR